MYTQVTPTDVHAMWQKRVRVLTGSVTYSMKVTPRWAKVFSSVANTVTVNKFDLQRFVDAQIKWAISNNRGHSLWPTILSGQGAISRYHLSPSDSKEEDDLREMYHCQYVAFNRLCETVSEEAAFTLEVFDQSPLFVLYAHYERGREPGKDLVKRALLEFDTSSAVVMKKIFPESFVLYLEEKRRA